VLVGVEVGVEVGDGVAEVDDNVSIGKPSPGLNARVEFSA
jgi:hypothetical protein